MICDMCDLPYDEPSMGGDGVCSWCDCGVHRDGSKWSFREFMAAGDRRLRKLAERETGTVSRPT